MKILQFAAALCVISSTLAAQNLRVVNAASLSSVSVAPGSIITIFGTTLTTGIAVANNAQSPPTSLGGVTVTIGGTAAALFYVSPTQINAVVDPKTPTGSDAVSVVSSAGTQTGTVAVASNAPPGLFSLLGTGTRDGAIVNAILGGLMNFSAQTQNQSTFLALFATGMNTSSTPTVTIGGVPVQVTFAGASPCCDGLQQINVVLPDSLAGAGRVPVVMTAGGQTSNTVQIVLLPSSGNKQFSDDQDNEKRNRELSALAYIPGTSTVISADENDDVLRIIDVNAKQVTHVVTLPTGANPSGVAVNSAGTLAAVTETGLGKVAIVDLAKFVVTTEVATGNGPTAIAIAGTQAVVVNQDVDSVSVVDLTSATVQKTIPVGRGPAGVAVAAGKAYVTNEDDGTVSVIDLAGLTVTQTIQLGASIRPEAIAVAGGFAYITAPAGGPDGMVVVLNLSTNQTTPPIKANPDRSGGSSDIAYFNGKLYFANQSGGSVSVLPVDATTGAATGAITRVKVDLGARALAIDTKDNLLVVSNEGTGTLVLVSLASNAVTGRIKAVQSGSGDDQDDHSDRDHAGNLPAIQTLSPSSGKAGTTFTLTITGVNLTGATAVSFNGNGNGHGGGDFTVKNVQVSTAGTQITATVTIDASAKPGARVVTVTTPNGDSADKGGAVFVVTQ
jgi:uncharacterized protein (TIGR03437 family)